MLWLQSVRATGTGTKSLLIWYRSGIPTSNPKTANLGRSLSLRAAFQPASSEHFWMGMFWKSAKTHPSLSRRKCICIWIYVKGGGGGRDEKQWNYPEGWPPLSKHPPQRSAAEMSSAQRISVFQDWVRCLQRVQWWLTPSKGMRRESNGKTWNLSVKSQLPVRWAVSILWTCVRHISSQWKGNQGRLLWAQPGWGGRKNGQRSGNTRW